MIRSIWHRGRTALSGAHRKARSYSSAPSPSSAGSVYILLPNPFPFSRKDRSLVAKQKRPNLTDRRRIELLKEKIAEIERRRRIKRKKDKTD